MVLRPMWVYVDEDIKILYIVYAFFICYYFQGLHSQNTAPLQTYTKHTHKQKNQKKEKRGDIY